MGVKWAIDKKSSNRVVPRNMSFFVSGNRAEKDFFIARDKQYRKQMETTQEEIYNGRLSEIRKSLLYAASGML